MVVLCGWLSTPSYTTNVDATLAWLGCGRNDEAERVISGWTPSHVYEPKIGADEAHSRLARWHRIASVAADIASVE